MTSSRQSARPIATRSEIWRTFGIRVPAARTVADRSASKRRAIARVGGGGPTRRAPVRVSTVTGGSPPATSWAENSPHGPFACTFAYAGPRGPGFHGYAASNDQVCLRLSRQGLAVGRDGAGTRRRIAGSGRDLRRGGRCPRRADQ